MENFKDIFLESLKDGSYDEWLKERIKTLSDTRYLSSTKNRKCIHNGTQKIIEKTPTDISLLLWKDITHSVVQWLIYAEMANTIWRDENLARSSGKPEYHPVVPPYSPPQGIIRSGEYIRAFKARKEKENGTFIDNNIFIADIPMEVEDYYNMDDAISHAGLTNEDITIFMQPISIKQGYVQMVNYSYPQLISAVWFTVSVISDDSDTVELVGIYVLRNPMAIKNLLQWLDDIMVYNIDDLDSVYDHLNKVLADITPKP